MDVRSAPVTAPRRTGQIARDAWRIALVAVIATRAIAMLVASGAAWLLSSGSGAPDEDWLGIWNRWDAVHILGIAEHGYSSPQSDAHATEWWPGFPLLVRVVMLTGLPAVAAGLLVSAAAMWIAFAYLYRLAEEEIGDGAGRRAVTYLALFPTAVFLVAPYTETLFLAGAIPAFYYARRDRWHLVALPAAAAMSSRLPGAFVLIGLAVEFLRQRDLSVRRIVTAGLALVAGTIPFVGYAVFLANARGDPLYFIVDAEQGWQRHFVGPIRSFLNTWTIDTATSPTNWLLAWRLEIVASGIMVAFVIWAVVKREWGYVAFMGTLTFLLISTTWYFSHPRMLLMFFPSVLFLAGLSRTRRTFHEITVPVMATIWALGVIVYTRGMWFF